MNLVTNDAPILALSIGSSSLESGIPPILYDGFFRTRLADCTDILSWLWPSRAGVEKLPADLTRVRRNYHIDNRKEWIYLRA